MIRVFDFLCANGHVSEHFLRDDVGSVPCPECGEPALKQLAAPRSKLEGISGSFPGATAAWEKRRESHMAKEAKTKKNHDTYK